MIGWTILHLLQPSTGVKCVLGLVSPPKPKHVCSTRIISQGNKFSCNSAADPNWFAECTGTCICVNMTFHCRINYWGINCVTLLSCYLCSCPNCSGEAWEGKRCWRCHLESCSNGSNSWKGMTEGRGLVHFGSFLSIFWVLMIYIGIFTQSIYKVFNHTVLNFLFVGFWGAAHINAGTD